VLAVPGVSQADELVCLLGYKISADDENFSIKYRLLVANVTVSQVSKLLTGNHRVPGDWSGCWLTSIGGK